MRKIINKIKKAKKRYDLGYAYSNNFYHKNGTLKINLEIKKTPYRFDVINYLLKGLKRDTNYLEIGVRNPDDNYNKINANLKYSVDPGLENILNLVDFKVTSDVFFEQLKNGEILTKNIKFDVIFIDGLHLAEQVKKDIDNSLQFIKEDGFIVLHDCNPPTEFHASESYEYRISPSKGYWNGTTWKAFFNFRKRKDYYSCCIDTDWGIGVISKTKDLGKFTDVDNPFFEYKILEKNREDSLNLMSFDEFKEKTNF
ncbi:class I SAM-dependent methyltransferase [Polaribacter sp. ALD11]|uniref:class I SAM-dependent methyltransferase n=1 Tax=Polaribacter sp. ALD11 TaxID=2058137 RepID=UPI000C30FC41|nr:class I SAM-dependent methyltransferase [Polaribacter sp. ALD11]AUC84427.1 class I SAM-dependent methyltransferase [Polaribacter sp. ALD11]